MVGFTTLRDLKTLGAMYSDVDLRNAFGSRSGVGSRMQVSTRVFRPRRLPDERLFIEFLSDGIASRGLAFGSSRSRTRTDRTRRGLDQAFYAAYQFSFAKDGKMVIPGDFHRDEVAAIVDEGPQEGTQVSCHAFAETVYITASTPGRIHRSTAFSWKIATSR